MQIRVGCSGWYYWRWRGGFYPESVAPRQWFQHYAATFRTVELNAPFYRWPRRATVLGWRRAAPARFRYAVKVNREITHERRMVRTKRLIQKFGEIADVLGPCFGYFLYQFPPSHRYTAARLRALIEQIDPARRNVVEFRHRSWWRKSVYRALSKAGIVFCSVSAPQLPEEAIKTGDVLYVRFHGRPRWYRHDYSVAELRDWARRIRKAGASQAWVYFNNTSDGFAPGNALSLQRLLRRGAKTDTRRASSSWAPSLALDKRRQQHPSAGSS